MHRLPAASRWLVALMTAMLLIGLMPAAGTASTVLPDGFVEREYARGLPNPTALRFAPDGRLFALGKAGEVWILDRGMQETPPPALQLDVDTEAERGLLGIDFDPEFASNGYLYLHYTVGAAPIHNRVSRFTLTGDTIDPSSERILLELPDQVASYHVGGAVTVNLDGTLLIGVGDNTRSSEAQELGSLLGKVLRINRDGSIPPDNPFTDRTSGPLQAIWAMGLRNPFTIAVDPSGNRIFVNDTGDVSWEEVNLVTAGQNLGWPLSEGYVDEPGITPPVYAYPHGREGAQGCGIDGGVVYRGGTDGTAFGSAYDGAYFFIDFCAAWIGMLDGDGRFSEFATGISSGDTYPSEVVAMDVSPTGELVWLNRPQGSVFAISRDVEAGPIIGQQPRSQDAVLGEPVTFEVRASGAAPLRYRWERDGVLIRGERASTLHVVASDLIDGSRFRAVVTGDGGRVMSEAATLTVLQPRAEYRAEVPATWTPSQTAHYPVTITNRGTTTWAAGGERPVRLSVSFGGADDRHDVGRVTDERFELDTDLAPGESTTVQVTVTAPTRPGAYIVRHQMVVENTGWFDDLSRSPVAVEAGWLMLALLVLVVIGVLAATTWYMVGATRRRGPA